MAWFIMAGCLPWSTRFADTSDEPVRHLDIYPEAVPDPSTLRVLTWNIKFGGGRVDFWFDGWGDRVHMSAEEVDDHLDAVAGLIAEIDPDIVLLQEVDVHSQRSAYVDQLDTLMHAGRWPYGAYTPIWQVDFVPEEGLGPMDMGMAVLSRWPITAHTRIDLPQSEGLSPLVAAFYLHRAIQQVTIDLGATNLTVLNNHPEAYALDGTKVAHLEAIYAQAEAAPPPMIVGGDLNVIPPGSIATRDYADEADVDDLGVNAVTYSDADMAALQPFFDAWQPETSLEAYGLDEATQATFASHSVSGDVFWTQKLDYLFTTETFLSGDVLQDAGRGTPAISQPTMPLSDHAPVLAEVAL